MALETSMSISLYNGTVKLSLFFPSEIEELSKMPSSADLSPVSGYVTFPANVSQQNITLFTVDDNEEEANEAFAIRLIAAKGGARLSEKYSTAKLTSKYPVNEGA